MVRNAIWFAWLRRPIAVAVRKTLGPAWLRPGDPDTWRTLAECLRGLPWVMTRRRTLPREVERGLRLLEAHTDVP
jgi:hypothetical protein